MSGESVEVKKVATPSTRVYVGNLSYQTSWQNLKDHLNQLVGGVTHADVLLYADGRSKGCGIVEFESHEKAQEAVTKATGTTLDTRQIFVREDREERGFAAAPLERIVTRGQAPVRGGRGGRGGRAPVAGGPRRFAPTQAASGSQIYVGNLPWSTSWFELKDLCQQHGQVVRADVIQDGQGRSRGFGIVRFANAAGATAAIAALNGFSLNGRVLYAKLDRDNSPATAAAAPAPAAATDAVATA